MGIQIDVNKGVAIAAVKSVFGPICPDAAAGLANRVATLPPPSESKNNKSCDLDHLLELCLDKWQTLNDTWRVMSLLFTLFSVVGVNIMFLFYCFVVTAAAGVYLMNESTIENKEEHY